MPPKYLAYDAYTAPDWNFCKRSGEETAKFIANLLQTHLSGYQFKRILEWGCGPGRVVRQLTSISGPCSEVYGSDYNPKTIKWCKKYIAQVTFVQNTLNPSLPFEDEFFDCVYAISVLTHLSETLNYECIHELTRVVKPRGLIILSTKGDYYFYNIFLPKEKKIYAAHGIVVRGNTQEGEKMYSTFHSPKFMRDKLLNKLELSEHTLNGFPYVNQDVWIVRKP